MDSSILGSIFDHIKNLEGLTAYITIFSVLLSCGLGLPIPEDVTLLAAGFLAGQENIELVPAIAVGLVGVLAGDFILFFLGRTFGPKILKLPPLKFLITADRLQKAQSLLRKNARKVCFTARFLAGLRAPIYLSAGILGVKPRVFLAMDLLASLISVPAIVGVGYKFAQEIEVALHYIRRGERYILIFLACVGLYFIIKKVIERSKKGDAMGKLAIVTALLLTSFIARAEDLVFDQPEEVVVVNKTDKTANTAKKNEKDLPYSEEELNKFSPEKFNDKSDK